MCEPRRVASLLPLSKRPPHPPTHCRPPLCLLPLPPLWLWAGSLAWELGEKQKTALLSVKGGLRGPGVGKGFQSQPARQGQRSQEPAGDHPLRAAWGSRQGTVIPCAGQPRPRHPLPDARNKAVTTTSLGLGARNTHCLCVSAGELGQKREWTVPPRGVNSSIISPLTTTRSTPPLQGAGVCKETPHRGCVDAHRPLIPVTV